MEIGIDTSGLRQEYDLNEEAIDQFVDQTIKNVALAFYDEWRKKAANGLGSTRKEYVNSLIVGADAPNTAFVELRGELPNMIEQGADAFDQKIGFANSPKRTMKKNGGWFLTIPFRHATPGALGEDDAFAGRLTDQLYEQVREQGTIMEKDLPEEFKVKGVRKEITYNRGEILFKEYKHKTLILAGLTQISKQYPRAVQSQYMTFRRVSNLSDPQSWIHPGFTAKDFSGKALESMDWESILALSKNEFLEKMNL